MKTIRQFIRDEWHMLVLMPIIYVPLSIFVVHRWELIVVFFGAELYSQSWHEDRHKQDHWQVWVNHWSWRFVGAFIALAGAYLLR